MDNTTTSLTIEGYEALYQQKADQASHPLERAMYETARDVLKEHNNLTEAAIAWTRDALNATRQANHDGSQDFPLQVLTAALLDLRRVSTETGGDTAYYLGYRDQLGGNDSLYLEGSTSLNRREKGIAVTVHATDVLTFTPQGQVILKSEGYHTVLTLTKMNRYLPLGMHVKSQRGSWVVIVGDHTYQFAEGLTLDIPG